MRPHHFERLNSLFQKELSKIIQKESDLPSPVFISVSETRFDQKINLIKVEIIVFPEEKKKTVGEWLEENKKTIKFKLSKKIKNIKRFPEINFKISN